jgi:hypothetical protein
MVSGALGVPLHTNLLGGLASTGVAASAAVKAAVRNTAGSLLFNLMSALLPGLPRREVLYD